ncbi:hypothetical protein [Larkinella arboricola]|uniref:Uncharacterized protein n=1 Tax=Larkinella arboricola TaxID=643671 RepID=A0A327WQ27_LARAB|nr:hypothetical protein [Larkinella arboricola]RAJ94049.1 hypothetical protein LX87_03933 [Larkinella arboricola]
MAHREKIDTMLGDTNTVLGGGAPSSTTAEGVNLVEDWIVILRTQPEWETVVPTLEQLRDALDSDDMVAIQLLLKDLADQTAVVAQNATGDQRQALNKLVENLRDFSRAMAK